MISLAALDWQSVAVTLAAIGGGGFLLRPLWTARKARTAAGSCGRCSGGTCGKESGPPREQLVSLGRTGSRNS